METPADSRTFFCHADAGVAISPGIRPVLHRIFLSKGKHRGGAQPKQLVFLMFSRSKAPGNPKPSKGVRVVCFPEITCVKRRARASSWDDQPLRGKPRATKLGMDVWFPIQPATCPAGAVGARLFTRDNTHKNNFHNFPPGRGTTFPRLSQILFVS